MKLFYLFPIILLSGCSLFRKTSKITASATFDLSKQTEAQTLDLKTKLKETQRYSYWEDSIFHQYEVIREQIDQSKASNVKTQENQETKQDQVLKESKPAESWVFLIILVVLGSVIVTMAMKK
ncbi:MAG: hypothetical protein EOO88_28905 [Pedobacter sp.]|nr:MAG: hypothetical protein EOO88_28905 [Pedobacter sp.]